MPSTEAHSLEGEREISRLPAIVKPHGTDGEEGSAANDSGAGENAGTGVYVGHGAAVDTTGDTATTGRVIDLMEALKASLGVAAMSGGMDLDEIDVLCAAATPGPWSLRPVRFDDWGVVRSANGYVVAVGRAGDTIHNPAEHRQLGTDPFEHNAAFIAAARTLVPQLVARVRQLEADAARRGAA